jgi:hypothetical protein
MDLGLSLNQEGVQRIWDTSSAGLIRFITDFVLILKRYPNKSLTDKGKGTILSVLQDHATWVASQEPKKPNNWTRTSGRDYYCGCTECCNLKIFLQNPDLASTDFTMNKPKREHIEQALKREWFTCTTSIFRQGLNLTLSITKTNKEYEENAAAWESKLSSYRANLQLLRDDFMKQLMGPEVYQRCILLEWRPSSDLTSESSRTTKRPLLSSGTSANRTTIVPPQVAGTKRKVETIDLSGDD